MWPLCVILRMLRVHWKKNCLGSGWCESYYRKGNLKEHYRISLEKLVKAKYYFFKKYATCYYLRNMSWKQWRIREGSYKVHDFLKKLQANQHYSWILSSSHLLFVFLTDGSVKKWFLSLQEIIALIQVGNLGDLNDWMGQEQWTRRKGTYVRDSSRSSKFGEKEEKESRIISKIFDLDNIICKSTAKWVKS